MKWRRTAGKRKSAETRALLAGNVLQTSLTGFVPAREVPLIVTEQKPKRIAMLERITRTQSNKVPSRKN